MESNELQNSTGTEENIVSPNPTETSPSVPTVMASVLTTYSLFYDSNGNVTGTRSHVGDDPSSIQFADNEIECSKDQYDNHRSHCVIDRKVVFSPDADLSVKKQKALEDLEKELQESMNRLNSGYPVAEQQSWPSQLEDAKKVLSGGDASALLSILASSRKTDVKSLAEKIVSKNEAYTNSYASILASYQSRKKVIEEATSSSDL